MKIDAEGFELNILNGGLTTLRNVKSVIVETSNSTQHRCGQILKSTGFLVSVLDGSSTAVGTLLGERKG